METKQNGGDVEPQKKAPSIILTRDSRRVFAQLKSDAEKVALFEGLFAFQFDGTEPQFEAGSALSFAFGVERERLRDHDRSYAAAIERARAGGLAGRGVSRNKGNRNAAGRFDPRKYRTAGKYSEEAEDATRQLFAELEPIFAGVNRAGTGSRRAFEFVLRKKLFEKRGEIVENARAWANSAAWKNRGFAKGIAGFFETGIYATKPPQNEETAGAGEGSLKEREAAILREEQNGLPRERAVLRVAYREARAAFPSSTIRQLKKRISEQREREGADAETARRFAEAVAEEAEEMGREERKAAAAKREEEEEREAAILREEQNGLPREKAVLRALYLAARKAVEPSAGEEALREFIRGKVAREEKTAEEVAAFVEEILKEGEEVEREAEAREAEEEREREEARKAWERIEEEAREREERAQIAEELRKQICEILNAPRGLVYCVANSLPFTCAEIKQNRGELLERVRAFSLSREWEERQKTLSVLQPLEVGEFLKDLASVEAVEDPAEAVEPAREEKTVETVEAVEPSAGEVEAVEDPAEAVEPAREEKTVETVEPSAGAAANKEEQAAKKTIAEICLEFQKIGVAVFCNKSSKQFFKKNNLTGKREELLKAVSVYPVERGGKRWDVGAFFEWFCRGGVESVAQIKSNLPQVELNASRGSIETGTAAGLFF